MSARLIVRRRSFLGRRRLNRLTQMSAAISFCSQMWPYVVDEDRPHTAMSGIGQFRAIGDSWARPWNAPRFR